MLPVNVFPVPNTQYRYGLCLIVDFIDHAVVAHMQSPSRQVGQLTAPGGSRIVTQFLDFFFDRFVWPGIQSSKFFLSPRQDAEGVVHFRFRSIRAMASSRGTGVSPEALASSYSRMASRSSSSSRIFSYSSMLRTTATFSPRSFTTNWRSLPMRASHARSLLRTRTESNRNGRFRKLKATKN